MDNPESSPINAAATKVTGAVASASASFLVPNSWAEVAGMLAAIYTACMLGEWIWKRVLRKHFVRAGFVKPRAATQPSTDYGGLDG